MHTSTADFIYHPVHPGVNQMSGHSSRCAILSVTVSLALALLSGCSNSYAPGSETSATATPTFSLPAGTYSTPQTVTIADATPNAIIHYTTNGSTPSTGSTEYTGAIAIASTTTLQAIAVAPGDSQSTVASATYTITASSSTAGVWTWMSGNTSAAGVYGTLGIAAPGSLPPARLAAMSWTDTSGNLWLFGGENVSNLAFNDLWKYNIATGLWTWVSGSNTPGPTGVYGTQGIAAAGNVPPPRYGGVAWTDTSGNLWLFGGSSINPNGVYNDLWKYTPQTNLWTWVSGSNTVNATGSYGTQGVPSASSVPGARNSSANWIDSSGNLWLFGGGGYTPNGFGGLNDLWKFSTATLQWTWVGGSASINQPGVYGTQGAASANNAPGARGWPSSWIDTGNNLWLFGGYASYGSDPLLNDLWKFNTATSQWTWVGGSSAGNAVGNYGAQGVPAAGNVPGSRLQAQAWTDPSGNFWLFGGAVYASTSSSAAQPNDLWKFNPTTGEWTWIGGTSAALGLPIYGTQGTPAAANIPGGRSSAVTWTDTSGNLWLFGGFAVTTGGNSTIDNDLWRYQP